MQWNAQGISNLASRTELRDFVNRHHVDIILLAETMLNKNHKFYLPDFSTYRSDREQHGGGVAICIRKSINHRLLPRTNTEHIENIAIAVKIDNREIMMTSAYCPRFGAQFTNDIKKLTPLHKEFMVFGDLNAKHSAWRCTTSNASGRALMDSLLLRNFNIHFSANPTHYPHSGATPSTLDILLTNSPVHISPLIAYEDELPSDHAPVVCTIDADVETRDRSIIYHFDRANWIAYKIHVNNSINRQAEFTNVNEIDNGLELLVGAMHSAKERSVPIAFKQNKMFNISPATKRLITERNALKRQWLRCSNIENRRLIKQQINSTNREISICVNKDRNGAWTHTLKKLSTTSKKFWHLCKTIKGKYAGTVNELRSDGHIAFTNKERANALANAFERAHTLTTGVVSPKENPVNRTIDQLERSAITVPFGAEITLDELQTLIKRLRNKKAPGIDGIANVMLKRLPESVMQYLANIFNACFALGYFPERFKFAKVKPLPKNGKDPREPTSYRPISLLSCIGKLFEKTIHARLLRHATENNLINQNQYGFRPRHSTIHQLCRVTKYVRKNTAERKTTSMVLLDIEKAFDTVWHNGLIHKIHRGDTPTYLTKIIQAFLQNRRFAVEVSGELSDVKTAIAGVPQGSVLSPLLYTLFISDFKGAKKCLNAYYADDTAICSATKTTNRSIRNVQAELNRIEKYLTSWKIKINAEKTQFIIFPFNRSRRRLPSVALTFQGHTIERSSDVKYLGVTLDQKLLFKKHIEIARTRALRAMRALYPMLARSSRLNVKNKNIIYKTMIRPIMTYAAPIWVSAAKTHIKKLQVVQNKALKQIHNLHWRFHTTDLHQITNYLLVEELIIKMARDFRQRCGESEYANLRGLFEDDED